MGAWVNRNEWGFGIQIPLGKTPLAKRKIKLVPFRNIDPKKVLSQQELAQVAIADVFNSIEFRV